jgi:hypothetical protein
MLNFKKSNATDPLHLGMNLFQGGGFFKVFKDSSQLMQLSGLTYLQEFSKMAASKTFFYLTSATTKLFARYHIPQWQ